MKLSKVNSEVNSDEKVAGIQGAYEAIIILRSSIADEDISKAMEKIKGAVAQKHGDIVRMENMGRKKLAYDVKKEKRGVFILIHFTGDRQSVFDIQRVFKLDEMIIKYMTVKITLQDLQSRLTIEQGTAPPLAEGSAGSEEVKEND